MNTQINKTHWMAIGSLFMGVTCLIAAEFIPISLLTSIAQDLNITEGVAGQSVTVVGIFAVIASLTVASLFPTLDRRKLLLTLMGLLTFSNLIVAFAPNYFTLLLGRMILGLCVGGFWSMTSAVVLKIAKEDDVPKSFSIVYSGVSIATIIALPLGSYFGEMVGWRTIFIIAAVMSFLTFIWQFKALPTIEAEKSKGVRSLLSMLTVNWILIGMIATVLSYGCYHVVFTYLKPYLAQSLLLSSSTLSMVLFCFGIANCIGTMIAGLFLGKLFRKTMIAIHLILMTLALLLAVTSVNSNLNLLWVILWGLVFGFIPVCWSTWITRTLADKAEMLGGLSVAAIQLSIGLAAMVGGIIVDNISIHGIFMVSAGMALLCTLFIQMSFTSFFKQFNRRV